MTKRIKIINDDAAPVPVTVQVWDRSPSPGGDDVLRHEIYLDHPGDATGSYLYVTAGRYVVVTQSDPADVARRAAVAATRAA